MKRSEAVNRMGQEIFKITQELETHPNYPQMTVREFNEIFASRLLHWQIAQLRMLPPLSFKDEAGQCGNIESVTRFDHAWEDE